MVENRPAGFWILVSAATLAVVVGVVILIPRGRPAGPGTALSAEERAYLDQILITDLRMSAARNFVGDTVTSLAGRLTNSGARRVRRVEIRMEFHDTLNQVVLLEHARPISGRTPPLRPGETRTFRVSFDHLPADWNRVPPNIKATDVQF